MFDDVDICSSEDEEVDDEAFQFEDEEELGCRNESSLITIGIMLDIYNINIHTLTNDEIERLDFVDLEMAYQFYTKV